MLQQPRRLRHFFMHFTCNLCAVLGSVHISSVRKILSAKVRLQGEKRSKIGVFVSILNAAGGFLSQKFATR